MTICVAPQTRDEQLHVRIKQDIKDDLKVLADANGLTMSSLVHSLIVRAIRDEKGRDPALFLQREQPVNKKFNGQKLAPNSSRAIRMQKPVEKEKKRKTG